MERFSASLLFHHVIICVVLEGIRRILQSFQRNKDITHIKKKMSRNFETKFFAAFLMSSFMVMFKMFKSDIDVAADSVISAAISFAIYTYMREKYVNGLFWSQQDVRDLMRKSPTGSKGPCPDAMGPGLAQGFFTFVENVAGDEKFDAQIDKYCNEELKIDESDGSYRLLGSKSILIFFPKMDFNTVPLLTGMLDAESEYRSNKAEQETAFKCSPVSSVVRLRGLRLIQSHLIQPAGLTRHFH